MNKVLKFSGNSVLLASAIVGILSSRAVSAVVDLDNSLSTALFAKEINIETDGKVNPGTVSVKTWCLT